MRSILLILSFLILFSASASENYSNLSWPREMISTKNKVTLYQPQLEKFEGNDLEARMAISVKTGSDLIFGAVWLKALVSTDLDERTVTLENINVTKINFPGLTDPEKIKSYSSILEDELESWNMVMSLDRLIASMAEIDKINDISTQLDNSPPAIYFRTSPTSLITIDDSPIYKEDDEFSLEYVVNTAFFIVKSSNTFYIKEGKFWYESANALEGYTTVEKAPKNVQDFADKYGGDVVLDSLALSIEIAPELLIVTQASGLITTDGEPDYQSIEGTSLLYAANTEDDIILDINSQEHYVLLAGRWYHSKNLKDGEWKFQEPDNLPEDFAKIPLSSEMANVRVSVPDTEEAMNAVLEQSIPQTAQVDRKTASVEVSYDGEPKFESITGTTMSYAINTDKTVLLIDKKYYCVDDAIWFVSNKATGPWEVSTERPDAVDEIPPESPVYNVKYVYIYDSTPEVVYVGYYPGYTYSYVYGGVVVYGTGYRYPYWYGSYYYPRPVTYGFGVHYNPYSGWGFSVGISVGWGYHPYGCWGPRGYYPGYRSGYNHGYRHGYNQGYNRGYNQGAKAGYAAGKRSNNNVYANRASGIKQSGNINRPNSSSKEAIKTKASNKPNNMYTDKRGDVYEQKKNGSWENKSNSRKTTNNNSSTKAQSKPSTQPSTRPSTRPSTNQQSQNRATQQQLNRDAQSRTRGTQNYNRSSNTRTGTPSRAGATRRR